jgi:HSP20 family protein
MTTTLQKNRVRGLFPTTLGEVDSLLDHFFGPEGPRTTGWRAPASVWEADGKFFVELDVPGVALENIELTFDKGQLSITAERPAPEVDRTAWHNERAFGKVTRTVTLPESADAESISAELNQGVLRVTVAKKPEAQPKKIEVKTAQTS